MPKIIEPLCFKCKNLIFYPQCLAFKKIPEKIRLGQVLHRTPYKGDNGIQFEKAEEP
jgi:hypothetical protein